jgi:opacity protein-like surface antigen
MNKRIAIGIACWAMFATAAQAAGNSGPYIGISGGLAQTGFDDAGFKEKDISYKAFGGYSFSDLIAFEAAYFDGGSPTLDSPLGSAGASLAGFNASVLLRARTGSSFALFAKVGYAKYDFKLEADLPGIFVGAADQSDTGISYGLGVTYTLSRKYLVRAEFEGISVKDGSYNTVMLGAGYRF